MPDPTVDRLLELGRAIAYPPDGDAALLVRRRIEAAAARPSPLRFLQRPRAALAVAVVAAAVALGAALAIPSARSEILRFFHLGGVRVERVETLEPVSLEAPLRLGRQTTVAQAQRIVSFRILVPELSERPRVYVRADRPPGGRVSFLVGSTRRVSLLLTEFAATDAFEYAQKLVGPKTSVELLSVDGAPGMWISGAPHEFHFIDRDGLIETEPLRLAGNTLIWQRDSVTYRLEGRLERSTALRVAATLR